MADKWEEVTNRLNRSFSKKLSETDTEIAVHFAEALSNIRGLMSGIYEKYEKDGVLSYADMVKYDRLTKFMAEINSAISFNYRNLYKTIYNALGWTYEETWDLSAWAIEMDAKKKLGYGAASPEQVGAMIANPIAGLTLKDTLEKGRQGIIWRIQAEITQGLARGETYAGMMNRLKPALDGDATKAMRIVRTEGHRVQEGAKIEAAQKADNQGVRMLKTWRTSKDQRVRHTNKADHKMLEGVTIPVDADFVGKTGRGRAPSHMHSAAEDINCRCFLQYTVDRVEKPTYNDIEQLSYSKWRENRNS
jgi:hypothetical protein